MPGDNSFPHVFFFNFSNRAQKGGSFPATHLLASLAVAGRREEGSRSLPCAVVCVEIMNASGPNPNLSNNEGVEGASESEVHPGSLLQQQKREEAAGDGPLIRVRVCHGSSLHELSVPPQSTFGELKKLLVQKTALEPEDQKLCFRGKQKEDDEYLHMAGVKDRAKLLLLEDRASKERKLERMRRDQEVARACEAITNIRTEVDKLAEKVSVLDTSVRAGMKVAQKEFDVLIELLMVQLLKLDGIEAEGEAKVQRRSEVRRIQSFVETLDSLKGKELEPIC